MKNIPSRWLQSNPWKINHFLKVKEQGAPATIIANSEAIIKSEKLISPRLWPNWSNAMAENKFILNLRSRVKKNQNFPILLLERQSIQLSKTGCNLSWTCDDRSRLASLRLHPGPWGHGGKRQNAILKFSLVYMVSEETWLYGEVTATQCFSTYWEFSRELPAIQAAIRNLWDRDGFG